MKQSKIFRLAILTTLLLVAHFSLGDATTGPGGSSSTTDGNTNPPPCTDPIICQPGSLTMSDVTFTPANSCSNYCTIICLGQTIDNACVTISTTPGHYSKPCPTPPVSYPCPVIVDSVSWTISGPPLTASGSGTCTGPFTPTATGVGKVTFTTVWHSNCGTCSTGGTEIKDCDYVVIKPASLEASGCANTVSGVPVSTPISSASTLYVTVSTTEVVRIVAKPTPEVSCQCLSNLCWSLTGSSSMFFVSNNVCTKTEGYVRRDAPGCVDVTVDCCGYNGLHLRVVVLEVDLDIDSDHTTDFGGPERDAFEDSIEDQSPGPHPHEAHKYVLVNDYYEKDTNGIPGYADGFNLDSIKPTPDDVMAMPYGPVNNKIFVPIVIELPNTCEAFPSNTTVRFTYLASSPTNVVTNLVVNATGTQTVMVYQAAAGNLRIWTKDQPEARTNTSVSVGGDYVPAGEDIPIAKLDLPGTKTLYLEGIAPSVSLGTEVIKAEVTIPGMGSSCPLEDLIHCTVIKVDVDVDSDNDNGFDLPDRSLAEDHYEDIDNDPNHKGKMIPVNSDDKNENEIPDYADGYDKFVTTANTNENFVPIVFEIPEPIDLNRAKIRLTYNASDPAAVTTNAAGEYVLPATGSMRIWTKPGNVFRHKASFLSGGDYVPLSPSTGYTPAQFGIFSGARTVTYYVEAVKGSDRYGDLRVLFEVQPDERTDFIAADAVRLTTFDVHVEWLKKSSPWHHSRYGEASLPSEPLGGVPGKPGGKGGFGGPPDGSGFDKLADPFSIKDFAFVQGVSTNVEITLTNNATLAWNWQSQYKLTAGALGNGSVTAVEPWYDAGTTVVLTATATDNGIFSGWTGDTNGCVANGNTISVPISGPRNISAIFAPDLSSLANGRVAYYPLNGDATDAGGNGYNGTLNGQIVAVDGVAGQCFDFDGISAAVNCPSLGSYFPANGAISLCAWVNIRDYNTNAAIIVAMDAGADGQTRAAMQIDTDGSPFFFTQGSDTTNGILHGGAGWPSGSLSLTTNSWHFIACVQSANVAQIYVDGVLNGEDNQFVPLMSDRSSPTIIGCWNDGMGQTNRAFNGSIDEVRLYNRSLTSSEIDALYHACTQVLTVRNAEGNATPAQTVACPNGMNLNLGVVSPVTNGSTLLICTGATVYGNAFTQESPTNVTMTLTNPATLAWNWQSQYKLNAGTLGNGSITAVEPWYDPGTTVQLTATAAPGSAFLGWKGDTDGCTIDGTGIVLPMTKPRTIVAFFVSDPPTNGLDRTLTLKGAEGPAVPAQVIACANGTNRSVGVVPSIVEADGNTRYVCAGSTVEGNASTQVPPTTGTISLRLVSNVSDWSAHYTLTEIETNSGIYADGNDSLAVRLLGNFRTGQTQSYRGTNSMTMLLASMAFGAQTMATVYAPDGKTAFDSEHFALTVTMTALPNPSAIDTITCTLTSTLTPQTVGPCVLTETSPDSLVFRNADGSFEVTILRIADKGATGKSDFTARVTSRTLEIAKQPIDAIETAPGSLMFGTDAFTGSTDDSGVGPNALRYVTVGDLWTPVIAVDSKNGAPNFCDCWSPPTFIWGHTLKTKIGCVRRAEELFSRIDGKDVYWDSNVGMPPGFFAPSTPGYYYFGTEPLVIFSTKHQYPHAIMPIFTPIIEASSWGWYKVEVADRDELHATSVVPSGHPRCELATLIPHEDRTVIMDTTEEIMWMGSTKPYMFSQVRFSGASVTITLMEVLQPLGLFTSSHNVTYRSSNVFPDGLRCIMQGNAYQYKVSNPPEYLYPSARDTDSAQAVVSWGPNSSVINGWTYNMGFPLSNSQGAPLIPPVPRASDRSQIFGKWDQSNQYEVFRIFNVPVSPPNGFMLHGIVVYTDISNKTDWVTDPDNPTTLANDMPTIMGIWDATYNTHEQMWIWNNVNDFMLYDSTKTYQEHVGDAVREPALDAFRRVKTRLLKQTGSKYTIRHRNRIPPTSVSIPNFPNDSGFDVFEVPSTPLP